MGDNMWNVEVSLATQIHSRIDMIIGSSLDLD